MNGIYVFLHKNDDSHTSDDRILSCAHTLGIKCSKVIRQGKPTLDTDAAHFSVSHSGDIWLCAFSSCPIGADVQQHKAAKYKQLADRFFTPSECKSVCSEGDFFDLWTKKEALLKLEGKGLSAIKRFDTTKCDAEFAKLDIASGYTAHICSKCIGKIVIINNMLDV